LNADGTVTARGIVIALGGNAIAPSGEEGNIAQQFRHTRESMGHVVALAREGWRIAIVHGNGPQIGNALVRNERARSIVPPLPLGVLVAATEGWIGYMIQQSLHNALERAGIERNVVTLVTQVLVDAEDPALGSPSKPIGRVMDRDTAHSLASELGWTIAEASGGWRRVVPSPKPVEIVERELIAALVGQSYIVVAAGGGGTPVYRHPSFGLEGIDGVIDKDRAAAVLARDIGAEVLLILTDVEGVFEAFGTADQRLMPRLDVERAGKMLAAGEFGAGSMGPKVEAAIQFVRDGGSRAIIARLDQGEQAVAGKAGTEITRTEKS
jgi:carbamate kinase